MEARSAHSQPSGSGPLSRSARALLSFRIVRAIDLSAVIVAIIVAGARTLCAPEALPGSRDVLRGAVLAFYSKETGERYAVVRIKRVYQDYQRHAFFRIGLLPVAVAEEVRIECQDPARLALTLAKLRDHLIHVSSKAPIEFRQFKLVCPSGKTLQLEAGRVRFIGAEYELSDGVVARWCDDEWRTSKAKLQLTDKGFGELTLSAGAANVWRIKLSEDPLTTTRPQPP